MTTIDTERSLQSAARIAQANASQSNPNRLHAPRVRPAVISAAEAEELERRRKELERKERIESLLSSCGVPSRYRKSSLIGPMNIPDDVREPYLVVVKSVRRLETEPGIIALIGGRGPGKTWIATALVQDFCRTGRSARWLHVEDYFAGLKRTYDSSGAAVARYESDHIRPELIALDALENRGDTPWEDRQLIRLVTKRDEMELKTILISNQDDQTFRRRVGDSIVSRTENDAGAVIICDWRSLRQKGIAG